MNFLKKVLGDRIIKAGLILWARIEGTGLDLKKNLGL